MRNPIRPSIEEKPMTGATSLDSAQVDRVVRGTFAFGAMIAGSLAEVDPPVTMPQWRVLVLAESEPQNVKSVAEDLGVHPSNATRLCDRLVRAGLLDRRQLEQDRRQVVLTLTPRGRQLVDRVFAHRRRTVEQVLAALPDEHRGAVAEAIDAFVSAAEHVGHDLGADGSAAPPGRARG
jgi:DNA-binding MarR family transcriptional regulator